MNDSKSSSSRMTCFILAAIIAIGVFFRFWHLGVPAFRADTILFWFLAQRNPPMGDIITKWFEVSGAIGQMPLAGVFMKLYLSITHLAVTPFNVRTPFAIFGLLAVPMAYLAGRNLYNKKFGLMLAAFIAFNTFAVYHSREAYVYAPILFGYFLYTAALFDVRAQLIAGKRPRTKSLVFFGLGIVFSCYSQITGAFIVATGALYLFWLMWRLRAKFGAAKPPYISIFALHAVLVLPLFIVAWGYGELLKQIFANVGAGKEVNTLGGENPIIAVPTMLLRMSWGTTVAALALTGLALVGVLHGALVAKDRRLQLALFFTLFQTAVFAATRNVAQATFEPRYLSGAFPFLAILWVAGLLQLPKMIPALAKSATLIGGALVAVGVLFFVYPSYFATQLTGKPVPYWDIVRWADANLPEKAPVLVDRWFEPWNEMRAHPGTNVIFTFTVPNEPLANFQQLNWRDTATNFFGKFPDAAYLEVAKTFFDAPGVGPWTWPAEYFGHHIAISNHAGLVLREWGLAPRGDYLFANTNRVVVDYYWNTREDHLAKFQKSGRPVHWLFAGGWGYENSGPMQMFRIPSPSFDQWRLINDSAQLEVINLSASNVNATLKIFAASLAGAKTLDISPGNIRRTVAERRSVEILNQWRNGQIPGQQAEMLWSQWKQRQTPELEIELTIPPGSTIITLRDPLWVSSQRPLFVDRISIR